MPRIQTCRGSPEVRPDCMAATQWLYSPVSTKVSEKTGILEIACCEMRNLVPPHLVKKDGDCQMSDNSADRASCCLVRRSHLLKPSRQNPPTENEWRAIQNKTTNACAIEIANIISHW